METQIIVRGYHTDLYQHVNNARYLEFLEEGRWQAIENYIDLDTFFKKGYLFFVVNINISYRSQAKVNDTIVIKTGLEKIGNKSAVIRQQIINKNTNLVCVDADITFVIADIEGKSLKIDGEILEMLEQLPLFEG
ncbi:MAG: thioesterase family protein [Pseudomonadota bacterium]